MGAVFNRQNPGIEELDSNTNNVYKYPPSKGNYFASHFIMAGERFETSEPECFLFGDNTDLNFLGGKPTPFPYPAPQTQMNLQTTLRSLINIRKESLRFVRAPECSDKERSNDNSAPQTQYNIEFTFDTDVRCSINIYYFCTEEISSTGVIYTSKNPVLNSETYHYKRGVNQQFSQVSHVFDPSLFCEEMFVYKFEDELIPLLIQCNAEEGEEPKQSHMIIAVIEKNPDATYTLKPLKQKLFVDGLTYLLQEIYGIENKSNFIYQSKVDEDHDDTGSECVICMSDARNTLILPCRHLCLCNNCADSLRYQASNCPICRSPFRALLQIRAVRKITSSLPQISHSSDNTSQDIPPGFEQVSLIEALNGPLQPPAPLIPSFVPSAIPPFGNSPDIRKKHLHRHLDRHHSSSASLRISEANCQKDEASSGKLQRSLEGVPSVISSDKNLLKSECLSLTRGEGRRHRKGFRTSSAPEKIRLLANSVQIVNEVGVSKRKGEKDAELAETRSLLESNIAMEENPGGNLSSPKSGRPCSSSPISLSTPHSLHLCEKTCKDVSSGGEDSDYFTPEDPSTTILVDQGTDTSLDTPQGIESGLELLGKVKGDYLLAGKHKTNREKHHPNGDEIGRESPCGHDKRKRNSDPLIPAEDVSS